MRIFNVAVGSGGFDDHLTDELLDRVVFRWKHLEIFELHAWVKLSTKSLISIALPFPRLFRLSLQTTVEIGQLLSQPKDVRFPCLTYLELHSITTKDIPSPEAIVEFSSNLLNILGSRSPLLRHLWFRFQSRSGYDRYLFTTVRDYLALGVPNFPERQAPLTCPKCWRKESLSLFQVPDSTRCSDK